MYSIYADGKPLYLPLENNHAVISPHLVVEMGKAGSLSLDLPVNNELYGKLVKLKTVITVKSDGLELFKGRILEQDRGFYNTKSLYCEGNLSFLVDSVQKNDAYTGTVHGLFRRTIERHNARMGPDKRFIVGRITVEDRDVLISGQSEEIEDAETGAFNYKQIAINASTTEWPTTHDYIQTNLIDYCGGYLRTRSESDGTYIDYLADYDSEAKQKIRFGVNLLDLTEEDTAEELFTVLIPLGDENLDISSVNNGSDEIVDEEGVAKYGRVIKTHVFDGVTDPRTLYENAVRYFEYNKNVPSTFTITAVDLHIIDPSVEEIRIGDIVEIESAPHNVIGTKTCTKIEYDLENPGNTVYTFGFPRQTLTQRYRKDYVSMSNAASEVAAAASGGAGGASGKNTEEKLDTFYKEWINIDPNNPDGVISLGTMYDHTVQTTAQMTAKVDENRAELELHAIYISDTSEHVAELQLYSDEHGSRIRANADAIELNANDIISLNNGLVTVRQSVIDMGVGLAEAVHTNYIAADSGTIDILECSTIGSSGVTTSSLSATDARVGSFTLGGSSVSKSTIPIVTAFTQASGQTAPTVSRTLLHGAIASTVARKPLSGSVTTF